MRRLAAQFGRRSFHVILAKLFIFMSTLITKGNWNITKGKFKQTLGWLTHDQGQFIEGKMEELVGRIQKRKGQARKIIEQRSEDYEY